MLTEVGSFVKNCTHEMWASKLGKLPRKSGELAALKSYRSSVRNVVVQIPKFDAKPVIRLYRKSSSYRVR